MLFGNRRSETLFSEPQVLELLSGERRIPRIKSILPKSCARAQILPYLAPGSGVRSGADSHFAETLEAIFAEVFPAWPNANLPVTELPGLAVVCHAAVLFTLGNWPVVYLRVAACFATDNAQSNLE